MQPDGRYYLELVGERRVGVERDWEVDGYRVCQPTHVQDVPATNDLSGLCKVRLALALIFSKLNITILVFL